MIAWLDVKGGEQPTTRRGSAQLTNLSSFSCRRAIAGLEVTAAVFPFAATAP